MKEMIFFQNKQWRGELKEYPIKRDIYAILEKAIENKFILSIEGPRRVGKSVLIKQLIKNLIDNNVAPEDILYFSFDDFKEDIFKLIKEYEIIRKKSLNEGKVYLFFDEIQKLNNWQEKIKIIYDNYINIKIVVSGSTLRSSKKESLAGRIFEYFIAPLNFKEYLFFSNNATVIDNKIDDVFLNHYKSYLKRQYPELALDYSIDTKQYMLNIIKKVIFEDSEKYVKNVNTEILYSIFRIISKDPGQIINNSDLSKDLGTNRKDITKYLTYLCNSGLIRKIYHFSNNARKTEQKSKKFYPFCTTLIYFIDDSPNESKLIETDVAFQINAEYFWDNRGVNEIDFIWHDSKSSKKIGVEVKYRNQITLQDINNFKLKQVQKLKLYKKYLIIRDGSIINFDANKENINLIKYYLVWRDFI